MGRPECGTFAPGRAVSSVRGRGAPIRAVAFLPDGKRFVTGSFDGTASVWDVASGKELHKLEGHTAEIFSVAVSPDGRGLPRAVGTAE